jgi:GT2 family glycosyltransferase
MISIIIPTKDRPDLMDRCMLALVKAEFLGKGLNSQVVVVETGKEPGAQVSDKVLPLHAPGGTFAEAVNLGVKASEGSSVLLLNNDCFLDPRSGYWLRTYDRLWSTGNRLEIIGANLRYADGTTQHAGVGFDLNGNPYHLWQYAAPEHPEVNRIQYVAAVTFACALIPRSMWDYIGGLDEVYRNAYEDVDFCLRAKDRGYACLYAPQVRAVHLAEQTDGRREGVEASWEHFAETWFKSGRFYRAMGIWPVDRR